MGHSLTLGTIMVLQEALEKAKVLVGRVVNGCLVSFIGQIRSKKAESTIT